MPSCFFSSENKKPSYEINMTQLTIIKLLNSQLFEYLFNNERNLKFEYSNKNITELLIIFIIFFYGFKNRLNLRRQDTKVTFLTLKLEHSLWLFCLVCLRYFGKIKFESHRNKNF